MYSFRFCLVWHGLVVSVVVDLNSSPSRVASASPHGRRERTVLSQVSGCREDQRISRVSRCSSASHPWIMKTGPVRWLTSK